MKKNTKYWRLGIFAVAMLMALFAGLKQGNGVAGLAFVGFVFLLALPYLFSDWVLPKIKGKREKRPRTGPVSPQPEPKQPAPRP